MIGCVSSVVPVGVEPHPARIEVFVGGDGRSSHLVDLVDAAVREAKGRVVATIQRSEFTFPGRRVAVNLNESSLILERHIMEAIAHWGQP